MQSNLSELFIKGSELVGNIHEFMTIEEFQNYLNEKENELDFIHSKFGNKFKDNKIGESGINSALIDADAGIAETGTAIVDSSDEQIRLATCLSENLILVLKKSSIVAKLEDISEYMNEKMSKDKGYIAFITGASRTADIERVLTIGVHGPVTTKIILLED